MSDSIQKIATDYAQNAKPVSNHGYIKMDLMLAFIAGSKLAQKNALLRELAMRGNYMFPENEQDLDWFDEGIKNQPDFFIRLAEVLGLGQIDELPTPPEEGK